MRSRSIWKLVLLISTTTACSVQPSTESLTKELKTVTSWTETAHLVGDFWLQGNVPNAYAKQTLQTTEEKLQKEIEKLAKVTPEPNRNEVLNSVQQMQRTVGEMGTAVVQKDRDTLSKKMQQLSAQEQAINTLIKRLGGES
ncbi:hypothetical protein ACE1CI_16035 [Aerosakkonemataceae cyanobacterium BLCC-F50]|uniref:Uncharacterized protein n=1 Tax=Floridaenema flaviceps BLCC-F50 TaxID=3153642 RepID=A0ABV4XRV6_9CYAN